MRIWQVVARCIGKRAGGVRCASARALDAVFPPGVRAGCGGTLSADFDSKMRFDLSVMRVFLSVGLASLALAAAGLFAVLSYMVNQRMREFAVRVAIGARGAHLWRLVLRDAAQMALAGTALGAFGGSPGGFVFWRRAVRHRTD